MSEDPRQQARLEFQQAAVRHGAGDARGAIAGYRRAIALDPGYAEAYCNMGVDLYDLGGIEPALAAYQVALALRPDFLEAHNNLGNALLRQGRAASFAGPQEDPRPLQPGLARSQTPEVEPPRRPSLPLLISNRADDEEHRQWRSCARATWITRRARC